MAAEPGTKPPSSHRFGFVRKMVLDDAMEGVRPACGQPARSDARRGRRRRGSRCRSGSLPGRKALYKASRVMSAALAISVMPREWAMSPRAAASRPASFASRMSVR